MYGQDAWVGQSEPDRTGVGGITGSTRQTSTGHTIRARDRRQTVRWDEVGEPREVMVEGTNGTPIGEAGGVGVKAETQTAHDVIRGLPGVEAGPGGLDWSR